MAAEYYISAFHDFRDLGLDEAADQVLKEGLSACPFDPALLSLAESRGLKTSQGPEKVPRFDSGYGGTDLGQLLSGMMQSQATSFKAHNVPEPERLEIDPKVILTEDSEMEGADFWKELQEADLKSILLKHGGLVRVSNFLPTQDALKALEALENLEKSDWSESNSSVYQDEGEFGEKSAKHKFSRYDGKCLDGVVDRIRSMAPNLFTSFQAAKYEAGGNLSAHDDSNYFVVPKTDKNQSEKYPAGSLLFRKIAVIYYLTKDWKEDYGGCLMDMHWDHSRNANDLNQLNSGSKSGCGSRCTKYFLPRFNSMVAFLVPRLHQVQDLAVGAPPRLSVFGWFSDDRPYPPADELAKMPWLSTLGG